MIKNYYLKSKQREVKEKENNTESKKIGHKRLKVIETEKPKIKEFKEENSNSKKASSVFEIQNKSFCEEEMQINKESLPEIETKRSQRKIKIKEITKFKEKKSNVSKKLKENVTKKTKKLKENVTKKTKKLKENKCVHWKKTFANKYFAIKHSNKCKKI